MPRIILLLSAILLFPALVLAQEQCFLATENGVTFKREGTCKTRYAPCSTFKIAISLMGHEEGQLIDATHPELPFKEGYTDTLEVWKQSHNPTTWMKNSCVWYSQVLMQKLGMDKFRNYVEKFDYGNKD